MITKMRTSIHKLTILLTIALALIPFASPSLAQSDNPPGKLLFTGDGLMLGNWTRDEKYLIVGHNTINSYENEYFEIATKRFVKSLPSVQLTAAEFSEFGIEPNPPSPSPDYAISPNGVYVAYSIPAEPEDGSCAPPPHLWLANRQTKMRVELPIRTAESITFVWGSDSHHLEINGGNCEGLMPSWFLPAGYIWNISPTLADLHVLAISNLQEMALLQPDISTHLLDISDDGLWMLVAVANWEGWRLVLVDVEHLSQSRIILDNIEKLLAAKLMDETPTIIIMVSATGLTELSLTGQQMVLDSRLTTTSEFYDFFSADNCSDETYVSDASISPSGRWLAYIHCDGQPHSYIQSLYVLDLHALRHPNNSLPSTSTTLTPVGS